MNRTTLASIILFSACSDHPAHDDGEVEPCIHDVNEEPAPPETPEVPPDDTPPCAEGLTDCFGQCVDIMTSGEHCGQCGRPCRNPHADGICVDGQCPPTWYCGDRNYGLENCKDVCDFYGQECVDGSDWTGEHGCYDGWALYFEELGRGAMQQCHVDAPSRYHQVEPDCDYYFPWWVQGGEESNPAGAARCCCTQDPV